jgi:hypothetical protein
MDNRFVYYKNGSSKERCFLFKKRKKMARLTEKHLRSMLQLIVFK